jgi:hypothetical protein
LSAGPIAASAVERPDKVAAATEPVNARKWRRDNADMLAFSPKILPKNSSQDFFIDQ